MFSWFKTRISSAATANLVEGRQQLAEIDLGLTLRSEAEELVRMREVFVEQGLDRIGQRLFAGERDVPFFRLQVCLEPGAIRIELVAAVLLLVPRPRTEAPSPSARSLPSFPRPPGCSYSFRAR